MFKKTTKLPKYCQVDEGAEFYNNKVKQWMKSNNIRLYSTYNREIKASVVERFILTLKNYFDILPEITQQNT